MQGILHTYLATHVQRRSIIIIDVRNNKCIAKTKAYLVLSNLWQSIIPGTLTPLLLHEIIIFLGMDQMCNYIFPSYKYRNCAFPGRQLKYTALVLIFEITTAVSDQVKIIHTCSKYRRATYVASTAPGLTTTSMLYLEPVSSLMVRVCPNLAPSDLKYTALLLGSIFREIPILTTWGTSAMFPCRWTV